MNLFREIPPTAGLPLYTKDLFTALFQGGQGSGLEEDFKNYSGAPFSAVTYSGTAAFYIILEALKNLSPKKTVVIPSFICPLIPLAIARAGLKVSVCDINEDNFDFRIEQLRKLCTQGSDILAIVAVHLAGLPVNFEAIEKIAKENGIFTIEDCAQSLGATYGGKKTGSQGDFAFYSLCRGKGITIYEGGAITTSLKFAPVIKKALKRIEKNKPLSEFLKILELFGYWVFYRPLLFWFVFRLPQIFWQLQGKIEKSFIEYFDINFPVHKVSGLRKEIGHAMFYRLGEEIAKQRQIVSSYITGLTGLDGIKLITEAPGSCSNYPYLTLLFNNEDRRREAFNMLVPSGLGVSQIYMSAISDYTYLKSIIGNDICPNARLIAKNHITLSTSTFLSKEEIARLIEKIRKIASSD